MAEIYAGGRDDAGSRRREGAAASFAPPLDTSTKLDTFVLMTPRATSLDFERTARVFHPLSEPTRLRLVDLLRGGERCGWELSEAKATGQTTLAFHLTAPRDTGIGPDRRV